MNTRGKNQADLQLVNACLANDEHAWTRFLRKYRKMCEIISRQYDLSFQFDDLFSEFIIKLIGTPGRKGILHTYNGKSSLDTYLSVVFRHMLFDYHRDEKHKKETIKEKTYIENYPDCDNKNCFFRDPINAKLMKHLMQEVAGLPDIEKTIIELYYYQELPVRTIAGIVGFSKSKVNRLILTIKEKLKTRIENSMGQ
jgi:RNA polymerase sigma factor (sigma-70 family)